MFKHIFCIQLHRKLRCRLSSPGSIDLSRSLMNYMAFNRKNHRIFHPKEVPPPPSSPPPPPHGEKPALEFQSKANLDAQMVLRGAIAFGKYDVTHDVVDSLAGAKVTPSFDTFLLMVEAMIASNDLPQASESPRSQPASFLAGCAVVCVSQTL